MKRHAFALCTAFALLLATYALAAGETIIQTIDLGTSAGTVVCSGTCSSFNPEQPGNWGGEFGSGAVTAFPGDSDPAGYVTFSSVTQKAGKVRIRHLDGIGDDSFDVYVRTGSGGWILSGHYTDQVSTEQWVTTEFSVITIMGSTARASRGKGHSAEKNLAVLGTPTDYEIKIVPTGAEWSNFNSFGQLAIDQIELIEVTKITAGE